MSLKKFFYDVKGEPKWTPLLVWFSAIVIVGIAFLYPEILFNFTHRPFVASITLVLVGVGVYLFYRAKRNYNVEADSSKAINSLGIGALAILIGLFGTTVGLKLNRESGIPDVSIYYSNGKVINVVDADEQNYYFNYVDLSAEDSVYVVEYAEEPGYNNSNYIKAGNDSSSAPRANENWSRPKLNVKRSF